MVLLMFPMLCFADNLRGRTEVYLKDGVTATIMVISTVKAEYYFSSGLTSEVRNIIMAESLRTISSGFTYSNLIKNDTREITNKKFLSSLRILINQRLRFYGYTLGDLSAVNMTGISSN